MLIHPDTLPIDAMRRRAWWRARIRRRALPEEARLLVIHGGGVDRNLNIGTPSNG